MAVSTFLMYLELSEYQSASRDMHQVKVSSTEQAKPKPKSIRYQLVKTDDVSYLNTPRIVYRVVLDVPALPLKQDLEYTAGLIRKSDTRNWAEFTVFMYLPEMNTGSASYYAAEFEQNKLVRSEVQELSLYGTKWEPKAELASTKSKTERTAQTQRKKYSIKVGVNKLTGRKVGINITTDFPEGANLLVDIYRIYWEKGKPDEYSGEMFSKDMPVKDGKISIEVLVDDALWVNKYMQDAEKFGKLIEYPGIGKISPNIEVSVLFSPRRDQPPNVLSISGKDGEFVDGVGAEKGKNLTTYRVTVPVDVPFQK